MARMNKRGSIPVVNEIVTIFTSIIPRPLQIMLFLILFGVITSFIVPSLMNLFGYDCIDYNGALRLYKVPLDVLVVNPSLGFRNAFGLQNFQNSYETKEFDNATLIKIPEQCIVGSSWLASGGNYSRGYVSSCVNCTSSGIFGWRFLGEYCITDGFYDPTIVTQYEIFTKNVCFQCAPPNVGGLTEYYFNVTDCISDAECYFRLRDESYEYLVDTDMPKKNYINTLISLGGTEIGQDDNELLNIQCVTEGRPSLFVFGIHVFDYTLWVLLIVGSFVINLAFMWYGVILK